MTNFDIIKQVQQIEQANDKVGVVYAALKDFGMDNLAVQLSAANIDIARALRHISDKLAEEKTAPTLASKAAVDDIVDKLAKSDDGRDFLENLCDTCFSKEETEAMRRKLGTFNVDRRNTGEKFS